MDLTEKEVEILNPESNRYRVCPYCSRAFMTNHRGRDFCARKCADEYNNEKKRNAKHANDLLGNILTAEAIEKAKELVTHINDSAFQNSTNSTNEANTVELVANYTEMVARKKTQQILAEHLGNYQEAELVWTELVQEGADFELYDSIEQLPHCELKKANYGNYSIVWTQPDKILITYIKNLLWTSI